MSEQFGYERCKECGYSLGEGHSPNCPNNDQSDVVYYPKKQSKEELIQAYQTHLEVTEAKNKKNKMNLKEAQNDAWKVRREAVKMKAQMEMGNDGEKRDVEILENLIHSGKAEQPPKENYEAGNMIAEYEKQEKQELEKVREKLKNIK